VNKDIIEEFYLLALVDIANGKDISDLEEAINLYQEAEEYEACAGILKAIHESGYMTIKDIINKLEDEQRDD
jgi:exonuclease VII small subunit